MIKIEGWIGTTLIDFPGKVAAEVFLGGCNFRCPFCHNSKLVFEEYPVIPLEDIKRRIEERVNFIDGVVISGGEPTIYGKELIDFVDYIKSMNLLVKLDTNGYIPQVIEDLIKREYIDFISMDIKSSRDKYSTAAGVNVNIDRITESIEIIKKSGVEYEFRTTVVPGIVEEEDIEDIGNWIEGAEVYVLQQFKPQSPIDPSYLNLKPYPQDFLHLLKEKMEKYVKKVVIR